MAAYVGVVVVDDGWVRQWLVRERGGWLGEPGQASLGERPAGRSLLMENGGLGGGPQCRGDHSEDLSARDVCGGTACRGDDGTQSRMRLRLSWRYELSRYWSRESWGGCRAPARLHRRTGRVC